MTQYFTDFTEYSTGVQPSDWTERWHTGDGAATVESSGVPSGGGSQALKLVMSSAARFALSWDDPGTPSGDVEILVKAYITVAPPDSTGVRFFVHGSGDSTSETAYFLEHDDGSGSQNQIRVLRYLSASGGLVGFLNTDDSNVETGEWWWWRIGKSSNNVRAKHWQDGDSEPVSWEVDVSDTNITSGWVGVGAFDADTFWFDQIGVGTGGDSAPAAAPATDIETGLVGGKLVRGGILLKGLVG